MAPASTTSDEAASLHTSNEQHPAALSSPATAASHHHSVDMFDPMPHLSPWLDGLRTAYGKKQLEVEQLTTELQQHKAVSAKKEWELTKKCETLDEGLKEEKQKVQSLVQTLDDADIPNPLEDDSTMAASIPIILSVYIVANKKAHALVAQAVNLPALPTLRNITSEAFRVAQQQCPEIFPAGTSMFDECSRLVEVEDRAAGEKCVLRNARHDDHMERFLDQERWQMHEKLTSGQDYELGVMRCYLWKRYETTDDVTEGMDTVE